MLLSIVIPVYNVAAYIERCLTSVAHQNIPISEYEIIVVNDGSPDDSLSIIERFAKVHDHQIIIINQENQGLSAARNAGLARATGDYVWFIDSDDWIEENCLRGLASYLKDDLDLLQIQHRLAYDDPSRNYLKETCYVDGILDGRVQMVRGGLPSPAPFTIFRRKFLSDHGLKFMCGVYHEDSEFKPKALYFARRVASYDKVVYNYYQRTTGSITSHFKLKNGLDILIINNSLLHFVKEQQIEGKCKQSFNRLVGINLNTLLLGARELNSKDQETLIKNLQINKYQFHKMLCSGVLLYVLEAILFSLNIRLGIKCHKLIKK